MLRVIERRLARCKLQLHPEKTKIVYCKDAKRLGRYYRSAMRPILRQLQYALVRWAMRKYKRLRGHWLNATHWLGRIARREPRLFASWEFGFRPSAGQ